LAPSAVESTICTAEDQPHVDAFNRHWRSIGDDEGASPAAQGNAQTFGLHLEAPPWPFVGAREARVVLLGLNPRFDPAFLVEDASIFGWVKRGLSLEQTTHPYWLLRDEFFEQPLAKWDRRILSGCGRNGAG
jgi:hypothetical protein